MNCKQISKLAVWAIFAAATACGGETPPTAEELLPILEGGVRTIRHPESVKTPTPDVVEAESVQDAVNAAKDRQKKELVVGTASNGSVTSADFVMFGSGVGAVATGLAVFEEHEDITASRLAQREAYVAAYMRAKANLLRLLRATELETSQELRSKLQRATDGKQSGMAQGETAQQTIINRATGLLRGYVVFDVKDEPSTTDSSVHQVFVTLAATPRTMGLAQRLSAVQIQSESLTAGLHQLLVELRQGLVPPIGARVIDSPTTGERAFVGFGSSVLMASEALAPTLRGDSAAEEAARLVSLQSLLELIRGDEVTWEGRLHTKQHETYKTFEPLAAGDPLQPREPRQVNRLSEMRREFLAEFEQEHTIRAISKGSIPPGAVTRTWRDPQQGWAFGIVVWLPSTSRLAAGLVEQMQQPAVDSEVPNSAPKANIATPSNTRVRVPLSIGPTGRLNPDDL